MLTRVYGRCGCRRRLGTLETGEIYLPEYAGLRCWLQSTEGFSDVGKRGHDQFQLVEPAVIGSSRGCDYGALRDVVDVGDGALYVGDRDTETIDGRTFPVHHL